MLFKSWKSAAAALCGLSLAVAAPAQARDGRYDRGDGGDDAAIAIGAGVVGLALGVALASGSRDRDYYYYDDGYYYPRGHYYRSYPRHYRNYEYRYPRHHRHGWRGDRHRGWGRDDGWGHRGDRRWRY